MTALDGWTIAANEVPDAGKRFARTANEAERQALACELGIIAVTAFDCDVRVKPLRSGRFHVKGTLKAAVEQACVVSLEPVAGTVEEAIDVEFWPQDQIAAPKSTAEDEWLDPQAPDEAEPIENGRIEVGRLAFEIYSPVSIPIRASPVPSSNSRSHRKRRPRCTRSPRSPN